MEITGLANMWLQLLPEGIAERLDALSREDWRIISSVIVALAVVWFVWSILSIMHAPRVRRGMNPFERDRREQLQEASPTYKWFEPLIETLIPQFGPDTKESNVELQRKMKLFPKLPPWRPQEYAAAKIVEGIGLGVIGFAFTFSLFGLGPAVMIFGMMIFLTHMLGVMRVKEVAEDRQRKFKQRLPYAVDLMALMMEAGASFQESLQTVVNENLTHPLGEELGRVLTQIELGESRRDALDQLQERIEDPDVSELVFAIIKGEELGTPLSKILRTSADQMRLKRSQWLERAAAQAQVSMIYPGLIIMVACLLVVAAPFGLLIYTELFG
ncbi:Hypothetical protein PBC10988_23830 [Planctomycetales bacterium 10988]|nr:Hypothetical protein PBC10988_23830 [Planctomycetales bacterium 10988]